MNKKIFAVILSAILVFSAGTGIVAYATDSQLQQKQEELDNLNSKKDSVEKDLDSLIEQVESQQKEVEKVQAELDKKQAEILKTFDEIEAMKVSIEERREGLNMRLRTMYKKGSVGYIDVLLGSNSLSELLSNVEMIQRIYRNDQKVLTELKKQHEELEKKQAALEKEKAELDEKKAEVDKIKAELDEKRENLQAEFDRMEAEAQSIREQLKALTPPPPQPIPTPEPSAPSGGGMFIWPATSTLITDYYGWRTHPIWGTQKFHSGVDIGCGYGTPIFAAASGYVEIAGDAGGYGLAVQINHGGGYTTFYAHNSSLAVSPGQYVNQGDVISYCGSTGWSTGPHLHFEVMINGATVDPMQYF